jgi:aconitate hydratase
MAAPNVARRLIESHLVEGRPEPGREIGLRIDQTLTQDATGTLAMLEFEALGLARVRTELSAQYVDHNLLQADGRNAADHLFLRSACRRFGLWYSPPGNGVSHPVHMERFGAPGKTLLGSDSHSCAAGSLGMLAIGAGGLEVALAMAGRPFYVAMPLVLGVRLVGRLPDWVSAKDVILELLRRRGVRGGLGRIVEYHGPGLAGLTAMDRHVMANMGAELGATTSVFPSDEQTLRFLEDQGRADAWTAIPTPAHPAYDEHEEIDLAALEPLIACPSSPGSVVPVREVAGGPVYQAYVGSSANPGLRDFAVPALMVKDRRIADGVSFDVNPTSRQVLERLIDAGLLGHLVRAGARLHQAGCNGCIGMGQAPAAGRASLRTVPRNFPGRSGTPDDRIYLCSPETATASALTGVITDPRALDMPCPRFVESRRLRPDGALIEPPPEDGSRIALDKGPNMAPLPAFPELADEVTGPVLLKVGDDVTTDDIMPAGERVLPWRSNVPEISKFTFAAIDDGFYVRALAHQATGFFVVGGRNYGQGSSREHAALAPKYLGLRAVIARGFARIHRQNLINFGILPLELLDPDDWQGIAPDDTLALRGLWSALAEDRDLTVANLTRGTACRVRHGLTRREAAIVRDGGLLNSVRNGRA